MTTKTIAPGIYQDTYGIAVRVSAGGGDHKISKNIRFPLGTPIRDMQDWQITTRAKLLKIARSRAQTHGTFDTDIPAYLRTAKLSARNRERRAQQLQWWADQPGDSGKRLGDQRRYKLEAPELLRVWNRLDTDNPYTRNLYRTALMHLWTVLDGRNAANPVKDMPADQEPEPLPRGLDYAVVRCILNHAPSRRGRDGAKTIARLAVFAYAPVTPAQMKLIQPGDLTLDGPNPSILVRGRRKGRGVAPSRKPLLPQGVEAFRLFVAAQAFGPFATTALRKVFVRARNRAAIALGVDLSDVRLYDLRHSFGSLVFEATGSDSVTGLMLDHTEAKTTRRYTLRAVPEHLRQAAIAAGRLLSDRAL